MIDMEPFKLLTSQTQEDGGGGVGVGCSLEAYGTIYLSVQA